jgi:hypothetical protein
MADMQAAVSTSHSDGVSSAPGRVGVDRIEAPGGGWRAFAGVMILVAGIFNCVYGISALANDDYFAADELLFGDLSMWGVFYLLVAAAQVITAFLVFARSGVGAALGIILAMLSATLALVSIGAYPIWSIVVMVVDGMIIYGLTAYGFGDD